MMRHSDKLTLWKRPSVRSLDRFRELLRWSLMAATVALTVSDTLPLDHTAPPTAYAEGEKGAEDDKIPLAVYITVSSPLNDAMAARVTNAAVKLQHRAEQEDRPAYLVLEIQRGQSRFGQVRDLAKELRSTKLSRVRTIAWIPEAEDGKPVDGYNVILALACNEIVMHPDAELGDVGRGRALGSEADSLD